MLAVLHFDAIWKYDHWFLPSNKMNFGCHTCLLICAQSCGRYKTIHYISWGHQLNTHCPLPDRVLWRQKLPRSLLWVSKWLSRAQHPLQPLQLYSCGERDLGAVWEAQLHGLSVHIDPGGVSWLPALDGLQRQHQVLQDHTKREFLQKTSLKW